MIIIYENRILPGRCICYWKKARENQANKQMDTKKSHLGYKNIEKIQSKLELQDKY